MQKRFQSTVSVAICASLNFFQFIWDVGAVCAEKQLNNCIIIEIRMFYLKYNKIQFYDQN